MLYAKRGAFHIANAGKPVMSLEFINNLYVHEWCKYPAEGRIIRTASQDDLEAMHKISEAGYIGWSLKHLQVCT